MSCPKEYPFQEETHRKKCLAACLKSHLDILWYGVFWRMLCFYKFAQCNQSCPFCWKHWSTRKRMQYALLWKCLLCLWGIKSIEFLHLLGKTISNQKRGREKYWWAHFWPIPSPLFCTFRSLFADILIRWWNSNESWYINRLSCHQEIDHPPNIYREGSAFSFSLPFFVICIALSRLGLGRVIVFWIGRLVAQENLSNKC